MIIRDRATFVHVFVSKLVDGQTCGYWPDSDQYSTGRRNVRNGLYAIWTPGHFFAEVDEEGDVARAATTASVSSIETAEQPRQRAWPSERA